VKQWINFDWGAWFIDLCRKVKDGQPHRRRFTAMFPDEWGSYYPHFQKDGVKIYILGRKDGDVEHWNEALPDAEVKAWGSENSRTQGLTIKLRSRSQAEAFLKTVGHYSEEV
jgi:hypothetical protein